MKTKLNLADFKENELTVTHKKAIIGGTLDIVIGGASEEETETNTADSSGEYIDGRAGITR